eukprot:1526745-Prymnesium_polylepis.2
MGALSTLERMNPGGATASRTPAADSARRAPTVTSAPLTARHDRSHQCRRRKQARRRPAGRHP